MDRAVTDTELAVCGAAGCAVRQRGVRFYVFASPTAVLTSQSDDERVAVMLSTALLARVGADAGFYELAFAQELARLRLGETCGEGVQADPRTRDAECDREALRWLAAKPEDGDWDRRVRLLSEARER